MASLYPLRRSECHRHVTEIVKAGSSPTPWQRAAAKTPLDKTSVQRQIDATDKRIDQLVYELYGTTDEEIKSVEETTAS